MENKLNMVNQNDMKTALRSAASVFGKEKLEFKPKELGTHLIRSGSAMAMYLDEVPIYTIMLLGCWSSNAFLRYIRN